MIGTELPEDQQELANDIKALVEEKMLDWTDEEYFNDKTFLTNSMLSKISQGGVQHLQAYYDAKFERKKHNDVGNHFHCIVLEPHLEKEIYFIIDDRNIIIELSGEYKTPRATKKYKEWREKAITEANGRIIIEWEDYDNNVRMKEKLMSYKLIKDLITNTSNVFEKIYYGKDKNTGQKTKCKLDIRNYGNYIADLKSTKDPVTPSNIQKIIKKYGYDRQAAFYLDVTGEDSFFFVFIEKTYPFTCGVVEMYQESIKEGREKNDRLIKQFIKFFAPNSKVNPNDDFLMMTF